MTFIAILIALVIERFFDWSHLRQWRWFVAYAQIILKKIPGKSPYVLLTVIIVPLLLGVAMVNIALTGFIYGFPKLVFQLFILLFCLGSQNLWADTFACVTALTQGDAAAKADKLKACFGVAEINDAQKCHHEFLNKIFIAANHRVFAVVFWFMVLGPVGAVLYRLMTIASSEQAAADLSPEMMQGANVIENVLDWIPVRILTFVFALGGEFVRVIDCWRRRVMFGLMSTQTMLVDCGFAALGLDDSSQIAVDGSAENSAIALLDRTFVILLVMIAVIELII